MNQYDEAVMRAHLDLCEAREAYIATLEALTPALPDGAPDVCALSPFTDGAVICLAGDVPEGWEWHGYATAPWFTSATDHDYIVEARPPLAPAPATERVPLAHVIGRTLPGYNIAVRRVNYRRNPDGWIWNGYEPHTGSHLPVDADGTVEVLTEAPAPEPVPSPTVMVDAANFLALLTYDSDNDFGAAGDELRREWIGACRAALNEDGGQ